MLSAMDSDNDKPYGFPASDLVRIPDEIAREILGPEICAELDKDDWIPGWYEIVTVDKRPGS